MVVQQNIKKNCSDNSVQVLEGTRIVHDQPTPMELTPEYANLMPSTSCERNREITKMSSEDHVQVPSTSSIHSTGSTDNFDDDFVILPEEGQKFEECSGRRIVDIGYFFKQLKEMDHESLFKCNNSHLRLQQEMRKGLASTFLFECEICNSLVRDRKGIQERTTRQKESSEWLEIRKLLLTASNFGAVVKRKKNFHSLVKDILYKSNLSSIASVAHGIKNEPFALQQLASQENVVIEECGLYVDPDCPYIGAAPDGRVGDDMIVENW
ncbi:uncharacterized protein LOC121730719 [Aricia agestis]|uniref:uncharacterized protein LOC121730719 n=1 Tax=Aricia agestis TaxID=91739 RepID=UPI001C207F9B|nr:uncharacterized protein LOC121730719 [Aricia agestis]